MMLDCFIFGSLGLFMYRKHHCVCVCVCMRCTKSKKIGEFLAWSIVWADNMASQYSTCMMQSTLFFLLPLLLLLLQSHTTTSFPWTRHLKRFLQMKYVGNIIACCCCLSFWIFLIWFVLQCNSNWIVSRGLITCLIFIRCSVSKFKMGNAHKQKKK